MQPTTNGSNQTVRSEFDEGLNQNLLKPFWLARV